MNKPRKITFVVLLSLFAMLVIAATFPLNNAFLQTDLNGNQKKITNLLELDVTTLNASNIHVAATNIDIIITNSEFNASQLTPQMFGALADGSHDDTAAIQAAIDAVALTNNTPSMVFFPPGTYKVTATLLLRSNSITTDTTRKSYSLQGIKGLSQINYTPSSGNCFEFRVFQSLGQNGHLNHFFMKDLNITGIGGTNNTANGVYIGKDMTEPRGVDAAGWDDRIEGCQIHKFKRGVVINNIVEAKIWIGSDIEQNWYASCLFTNADTWQVKDTVLGDPAAGVDNILPLTFTNLCAIETWLGVGGRIEGCEAGRMTRFLYARSTPITVIGGNIEGCEVEGFYNEGITANSLYAGIRIVSVGDGGTNYPIFHFDNDSYRRVTISSVQADLGNRFIKEDSIYAYFQPTVIGADLSALTPAQYNTTTFYTIRNGDAPHLWTRSVALNTAEMTNAVVVGLGASTTPSLVSHGVFVASNSAPYLGVTVPYGLGFTQVRSTVSFAGDTLSGNNMRLYLNPNTYRFPHTGLVQDDSGQAYLVTGITNGLINTFITTNTFANDTDPREMWIKCYSDNALTLGVTNAFWIVNWQLDSIP